MQESEKIEFKKTLNELNEAMLSISAMLNKHGEGTLYLGLKNDGSPYRQEINDGTLRNISRKVYESIKPQIFPLITIENFDGIDVIVVNFKGEDKPYSAFGKYYIRVADENKELNPLELRKIMVGQEYKENWEIKQTNVSVGAVDANTISTFLKEGSSCGRLESNNCPVDEILNKLSLSSHGYLNNAGNVLFSNEFPIALKAAVFAGKHKETFLDIKTFEGNIFQLIDKAISYITSNIKWSLRLSEDGVKRKEMPEIPLDVIRESVINSFVHARYDLPINHEICIFSDRITITNPGSFASEHRPEDFAEKDLKSYLRNKLIARSLYLCKDVESFGSGLRKIYKHCEDCHIKVSYINTETSFTLELSRREMAIVQRGTLNEEEKNVLDLIAGDSKLSALEIAYKIGKAPRTVQRILESLKAKKIIKRSGSRKDGHWELLEAAFDVKTR